MTAVTRSIIPAYMIHGSGNLFEKASSKGVWANKVSAAVAFFGTVAGFVLLGFILIWDSR